MKLGNETEWKDIDKDEVYAILYASGVQIESKINRDLSLILESLVLSSFVGEEISAPLGYPAIIYKLPIATQRLWKEE